MKNKWMPNSWRLLTINQQPDWKKDDIYFSSIKKLTAFPPLVFAGEVNNLIHQLSEAAKGKAFVIQGGDCAETFSDFSANSIKDKLKILLQMSVVLTYGAKCNIIKIGRIAGQFAKPRSNRFERIGTKVLPAYRGDSVNGIEFNADSRKPNPKRLVKAYNQSAATLNLLRAFTNGGYADLNKVHLWNQQFLETSPEGKKYKKIAQSIDEAMKFIKTISMDNIDSMTKMTDFFTSHEALLLDYEEALTRKDSITNKWYDCSAHFLWVGDRTRDINGAHIEFLSGINNPIGIKIGPTFNSKDLIPLLEKLNPDNIFGKVSLIIRLGIDYIEEKLPKLIHIIKKNNKNVLWLCDPMHGNTFKTSDGIKTRDFSTILDELSIFFKIHHNHKSYPGGVHFELTGNNVTECLGGSQKISHDDLKYHYETACDPRLNNQQSLELAYLITNLINKGAL
tara:strand:- start:640 stop:1989 length:1350 start_codon:yes stop_codon:yes gene_type:complete